MEGIAKRLFDSAKAAYDRGDLDLCHELAALLATRFAETEKGQYAASVIDQLEAEMDKKAEAKVAKREKEIQEKAEGEARKAAEAHDKIMREVESVQKSARKANASGLRANNRSTAKKHFERAAADFKKVITMADNRRKKHADNAGLVSDLDAIEKEAKDEGVQAYINAGNIELWRENWNGAQDYGKKALEIDPESQKAKSYMNRVQTYFHMRGDNWGRPGRR